MNHQPFKDWLLSDEKLSADQTQALQDHMHSCESCNQIETAWLEVESAFHKIPSVQPAPGFTARWQVRLEEYQLSTQKRKSWIIIGLTSLMIISLFAVLTALLWSLLQEPGPYLVELFNRLLGLVSIYYTLQDIFHPFTTNIPFFTFVGMFFLVGIISFMSVLWLTAYQKFSMARRFV